MAPATSKIGSRSSNENPGGVPNQTGNNHSSGRSSNCSSNWMRNSGPASPCTLGSGVA